MMADRAASELSHCGAMAVHVRFGQVLDRNHNYLQQGMHREK